MTADTVETRGVTGTAHWSPGDQVLWRYRANGRDRIHICRPVTVVRDTDELLAVWLAADTHCVKPRLADGTEIHHEPLTTRYTKPRTLAQCRWLGTGVLKLARPADPVVGLAVLAPWLALPQLVREPGEEPRVRWSGGVDSEDHFLDIAVYPDRSWEWKDEDEFAQAQRAGLMPPHQAARVRAAVRAITSWTAPFRDGWEDWRPDPNWPVPELPVDWHRTLGRPRSPAP